MSDQLDTMTDIDYRRNCGPNILLLAVAETFQPRRIDGSDSRACPYILLLVVKSIHCTYFILTQGPMLHAFPLNIFEQIHIHNSPLERVPYTIH